MRALTVEKGAGTAQALHLLPPADEVSRWHLHETHGFGLPVMLMPYDWLRSRHSCLAQWVESVLLEDIVGLLDHVRRTKNAAAKDAVLVLVFPETVVTPITGVRDSFGATLPAIAINCSALFVAIEHRDARRDLFRSMFAGPARTRSIQPVICDTMQDAISQARRVAPQEVLDLQRAVLRRQFPRRTS